MPKTLGREREEQRDREEGGGEGRRHDGRRIFSFILVHAIKDYVDCLTLFRILVLILSRVHRPPESPSPPRFFTDASLQSSLTLHHS